MGNNDLLIGIGGLALGAVVLNKLSNQLFGSGLFDFTKDSNSDLPISGNLQQYKDRQSQQTPEQNLIDIGVLKTTPNGQKGLFGDNTNPNTATTPPNLPKTNLDSYIINKTGISGQITSTSPVNTNKTTTTTTPKINTGLQVSDYLNTSKTIASQLNIQPKTTTTSTSSSYSNNGISIKTTGSAKIDYTTGKAVIML